MNGVYTVQNLVAVGFAALLTAGLYAAMSYGLSLIYGVMRIINLSHAGIMMFGAFSALVLYQTLGLDPVVSSFVILPVYFVAGVLMYVVMVQRVRNARPIASLLLLFGFWLVLQNIAYAIWGTEDQSIHVRYSYATVNVGGIPLAVVRLIVFAVAVVLLVVMWYFLQRTYLGKAIRAVSQNPLAAQVVGIDVQRISAIAFGIGTAFSAFAGSLFTLLYSFTPDFGSVLQLKSFTIIVLGGIQSFSGVALGALVLSFIESYSVLWIRASFQNLIAMTLLVVALAVLPGGLSGLFERGRRA